MPAVSATTARDDTEQGIVASVVQVSFVDRSGYPARYDHGAWGDGRNWIE